MRIGVSSLLGFRRDGYELVDEVMDLLSLLNLC